MKFAQVHGESVVLVEGHAVPLSVATGGKYASLDSALQDWPAFLEAVDVSTADAARYPVPTQTQFGPPVGRPGQVFGVGLNFAEHRREAATLLSSPDAKLPLTFTKYPSSIVGPTGEILLPTRWCDFEVELVAVLGRDAEGVAAGDAGEVIAGYMVGQDISDRSVQYDDPPQLSLSKSFRTFSPVGPALVTSDELNDLGGRRIRCWVNGELQQDGLLSEMIMTPAELVELFSSATRLRAGDLIFCGTPAGVGHRQVPPRFLKPGDVVESEIEGLGRMANRCVPTDIAWRYPNERYAGVSHDGNLPSRS